MKKLALYIFTLFGTFGCLNPDPVTYIATPFETELTGLWKSPTIVASNDTLSSFLDDVQNIVFTDIDNRVTINYKIEGRDTVQYGIWKFATPTELVEDSTQLKIYTCDQPISYSQYMRQLSKKEEELKDQFYLPTELINKQLFVAYYKDKIRVGSVKLIKNE